MLELVVLLVMLVFAALLFWLVLEHKRQFDRIKAVQVEQHSETVRLIDHYRHDLMNELQVLYGYIGMKKYDKIVGIMEGIKLRASIDSRISKLEAPSLAVQLYRLIYLEHRLKFRLHFKNELNLRDQDITIFLASECICHLVDYFHFRFLLDKPSDEKTALLERELLLVMAEEGGSLKLTFEVELYNWNEEWSLSLQKTIKEMEWIQKNNNHITIYTSQEHLSEKENSNAFHYRLMVHVYIKYDT